jgi:hypothetical protein
MVRALLAGTKTQTRRIVKPQPTDYTPGTVAPQRLRGEAPKHERPYFDAYSGGPLWCWWDEYDRQGADWIKCPYGVPGDTLWVRETLKRAPDLWTYAADGERVGWPARQDLAGKARDTVVSIHMPRNASRITLRVADVRVERLNEITPGDAMAEGITTRLVECADGAERNLWFGVPHAGNESPVEAYADLWDSINNPRGLCPDDEPLCWAANPWVWAVSFEVEAGTADPQASPGKPNPDESAA